MIDTHKLPALAEQADGANIPDGISLPEELERRKVRLAAIATAKAKIEERAAGDRWWLRAVLQRPSRGRSRDCLLGLVPPVAQAANDQQQLTPMPERLAALPEELPKPEKLTAEAAHFSAANLGACEAGGIEPSIAIKRDTHHPHGSERFESPAARPADATAVQRMTQRLKTAKGRATDALRKQTVEPVFGIIQSMMWFRQSLTCALDYVPNEWTLVCLAWNLQRMAVLRPQ